MTRPDVAIQSTLEYEDERRRTRFSDSEEATFTYTQEVEVGTDGWVYHPALAVYAIDLRPRFKLQTTDAGGAGSIRDDRFLFLNYVFNSTFLPLKPYTFDLFSSRSRSDFNSTLARDTITDTGTDRAKLFLKYQPLPTTITAERRTSEFKGFTDFRQTTYNARVETRHRTDASNTALKAEYIRQERTGGRLDFTIDRRLANARNLYRFSDDARLTSSLSGSNTVTDTRETTVFDLSENLWIRHSENFTAQHQARYRERHLDDFSSRTVSGATRLSHQLYDNLRTRFQHRIDYHDFEEGDIRVSNTDLDFRYRRSIPWGFVGLDNGYSVRLEDDNTDAVFRDIIDEALVMTGTSLAFLDDLNVVGGSIVVTDSTGLIIYTEGVDYLVVENAGATAIARFGVGSGIPDGSTVLVDYRFLSDGPSEIYETEIRGGFNLSLWEAVRLSYRISRAEEKLISGRHPRALTDDLIQRARIELKWRWSTTSVEYEDRDTVRAPSRRLTARENLFFRPWRRLSIRLNGAYSQSEVTDTGTKTRQWGGDAALRWQPFRGGDLNTRGFARQVRGDIQDTDDIGFEAEFRQRFGLWSGSVKYDFLRQRDNQNDQTRNHQRVFFRIRRDF